LPVHLHQPQSATSAVAQAALAGGLLALAFPPFPLGFLAFIALAWILLIVHGVRPRVAAVRGYVFGFVFHFGTIYWTGWVSGPGMLVMVAILALYVSAVFWLYAWMREKLGERALWLFPFVWIAHEYLRGVGDLAFPWTNLSLSQVHYIPLIQFADITGDLGVGLWVCFISVVVCRLVSGWRPAPRRRLGILWAILIILFAAPYLYGRSAIQRLTTTETVRVAVLQGDIDSNRKWDSAYVDQSFAIYEAQTRAAAAHGARLIIWPETSAPVYLRSEPQYHHALRELSGELGVTLLIGTLEYANVKGGGYLSYNAAVMLDTGIYHPEFHAKLHLVPLGEWIPFSDRIKVLDRLEVGGAHFTYGTKYVLFPHEPGPFAAAICFESVFPEIVRGFALAGARFLVSITNDGWYGFSSGPTQHALIAVFRAIETRYPIARSANTGISALIDRAGRLHDATAQYIPDVIVGDMPLGPAGSQTFFVRHGMFVGSWCLILTIVSSMSVVLASWRQRLRSRREP
jgi:apolipoprotein N-acyltransferase